jgi:hypothetical protein
MSAAADRDSLLRIIESQPILSGRFSNLKRIGSSGGDGHFSLLVTADDSLTGNRVALKFYDPIKRFEPDASYRFGCFAREAEILEKLKAERDIIQWVAPISEFLQPFTAGTVSINFPFAFYALEEAETDVDSLIASGEISPEQLLPARAETGQTWQPSYSRPTLPTALRSC